MSAPRRPSQPRRLGEGRRAPQPEPLLSSPNEHAPRRRRPALAIVAAIAGTGLVVGGGFVAIQVLSSGPESRPAANGSSLAPTTPSRDEPIEPTSPEPTTSPSKKAKAKSPSPTPTRSTTTPAKSKKPTAKPPTQRPKRKVPQVPTGGMNSTEAAVFALTNKERAKAKCPALRADNRLVLSARRHSADMAVNNYFAHNSQDGTTPWKRMERAGYTSPGAENIAKGYGTAAAVMKGWMNSPGHRANILNCKLRAIGVGMAKPGPVWTQNFGWQ